MKPTRTILLMWLAWSLIVIGFQFWVTARIDPKYPDRAQEWTTQFTKEGYQNGHVYLLDPFMNQQVAWDSEYYLAISVGGYDDPRSPHLTPIGPVTAPDGKLPPETETRKNVSVSYAFFPFYPFVMKIFAFPLRILGMNPIATATLAGVLVSALGTLLAMFSLFDLTRDLLGEDGALRAVFYLLIFPTSFFFLQVYTEGLFVGLAFASLMMLRRKQWLLTAVLAVCATLTRAVGITLIIPMMITWLRTGDWMDLDLEWRQIFHEGIALRPLYHFLLALSPLIAFLIWKFSYLGLAFDFIESNYFGRGFLSLGQSFFGWAEAFRTMLSGNEPQHSAYYFTEFLGFIVAVATCMLCIKISPELGWFSFAVILISWGSGPAQGIHRYALGAPAVFLGLAVWGKNIVFDRAWTILSLLLMGSLAMLFAMNLWVA